MNAHIKLLLVKVALAVLWTGVGLLVLVGSVPESPFPWTSKEKLTLVTLAPEGWAFFTRNPREHVTRLYRKEGDQWVHRSRVNFSPRNWMGVKRTSTVENVEIHHLIRRATGPDSLWTSCAEAAPECAGDREVYTVDATNVTNTQRFCGTYLVQKQEPVPWAWSDAEEPVVMPSRIVQINISCSDSHRSVPSQNPKQQ